MEKPAKPMRPGASQPPRHPFRAWGIFVLFTISASALLYVMSPRSYPVTWQKFETKILARNAVREIVVINKEIVTVYLKPEFKDDTAFTSVMKSRFGNGVNPGPHYSMNIGSVEYFEAKLETARQKYNLEEIEVSYENSSDIWDVLGWALPFVMLFLFLRLLYRPKDGQGVGGSLFGFGRSTARLLDSQNKSSVTFNDVAGLAEAKQEVREVVDFLKDPQQYTRLGAKIPKGIIIVGPPGTGKTLLAKAVAGEAQVPFFTISGSEFVEMFVGVGASRVRDLFKSAKEKAPCIIFIDEIDAVGRSRGRNAFYSGSNDERESTLNQLLTEMDGFGTNSGVIVLAATNRADVLDPALLRPGRFDRHIYLELPNLTERKEIFQVHLKPLKLAQGLDIEFLSHQTPGFSGADIANICNEAALIAARKKKQCVEKDDFMDAIDRIIAGLEKKSKIIRPAEKRIIAFHESGHAIVSWYMKFIDPLQKISIIPRGKSLGAAWYLAEERNIRTLAEYKQRLSAALAGRAAEEIVFGEVSSGAVDDLEKVTKEAYTMVAYLGFDAKIGNVSFYDSTGDAEGRLYRPYSEQTARLIDEEVRKLVRECYEDAKTVLVNHHNELIALAKLLLEKEVLYRDELEGILGKSRNEEPLALLKTS